MLTLQEAYELRIYKISHERNSSNGRNDKNCDEYQVDTKRKAVYL
ncbi:Uncharacterised protein [Enterococcus gallinarum]|uniref:Uncharacterized protein n=1 Tax=Enterococcus gallinarum TaxID=1353 RepID=A0A376H158_ENTGA|nr:Uncharacterised protein [Enterococcus gallinarum]STD82128.1 Uncharacterised protein [Enterococcus gallinarum]